jgi:two-component system chemotaxis response regulator CheB
MTDEPILGPSSPLVVVGASAGGVDALTELVRALPGDLPAPVLVVLHMAADKPSLLPRILSRATELTVETARDGELLQRGHVHVAPPGRHLVVRGRRIRLESSEPINGHRPAVDPLFTSAAAACGPDVVGVILSGTRADGTAGLAEVKARGGTTLVQDPRDALHAGMPTSAIDHVSVDAVLPIGEIAKAIACVATTGHLPCLESA